MIDTAWDGPELLAALRHAARALHSRVEEINALNVFPVPDGDTGSNMLATVRAAIDEADVLPQNDRSVSRVGSALTMGALMGARGNSGVILSQLFRGMGDALNGSRAIAGMELAEALTQGCRAAVAAVSKPVEGTILTVARDAADAATSVARSNGRLEAVLSAAALAASASVEQTPNLLPILRQAGVVDAGGKGLEILLHGALAALRGEPAPDAHTRPEDIVLPIVDGLEAEGYGYETVYMVQPREGGHLDIKQIRDDLDQFGVSVLVAGDHRAVKIHIHTERPDEVIAYGLRVGTLSRILVENLDRQAMAQRELVEAAAHAHDPVGGPDGAVAPSGRAVVAVAPGEGIARVFQTVGATTLSGGQGANPSAGDIAAAIKATNAAEVIVLPNNSNVHLAARQAGKLVDGVNVEVVATRNAAEGIAAALEFDPDVDLATGISAMAAGAKRVQTLQVTAAVRDARIGGRKVKRDEYIVLDPDDGLMAANNDRTMAVIEAVRNLTSGFELLTIYRGEGINFAVGEALREALLAEIEGIDVDLVEGGQPHYDFLISAE